MGRLLIISRKNLLAAEETVHGPAIFRLLANCTRKGCFLLLTAPEPDQWLPTRGTADNALSDQGRVQQKIHDAGGDLDGVYYVPRSLFTQDRNREGALKDILVRYTAKAEETVLVSSSVSFVKAAERLSFNAHHIPKGDESASMLLKTLEKILESSQLNTQE